MRQLIAFTKKEFMEQRRSGRLLILVIIFCMFGIMNPAIAKLTPWMMDLLSKDLAESGIIIKDITVDALTSWTQFYKNMPIALIIFLVMFGGIFSTEYYKGTLINVITKGLKRWKIVVSKTIIMAVIWTLGYLICFGITYGYNSYFWDNSIAKNLIFSSFCLYLFGMWLITIIPLASTLFTSTSTILLFLGGVYLGVYLLSFLPDLKEYCPTYLTNSSNLLVGAGSTSPFLVTMLITIVLMCFNVYASLILFNKRNI